MQIKCHFRNEFTEDFNATPVFRPKSKWTPPLSHPNLEMFLSKLEKELLKDINFSHFCRQKFSSEECKSLKVLAEDKRIVIKSADNG